MEFEYNDQDLTLQEIMADNSELEYITKERNLVPSMIEQICTELTRDKFDRVVYRSRILVRKEFVDYLESLGYNLFRQFESEKFCEYFDRPIAKKSDENENGTVEFTIVTGLEYAHDIFNYGLPLSRRMYPAAIMDSPGTLGEIEFRSSPLSRRNILDNEASSSNSPVNNIHSRSLRSRLDLPVWGSTERLPTSPPNLNRLLNNLSSEEDSLDSEGPSNREGVFVRVATLRSTLRDGHSNMSEFQDLNIDENEDSNSVTKKVNDLENHLDIKREDCVRRAVSLDASPENSNLSDQEQADNGLFIRENSYFPKHLALKRSASSPAASPRSSFRTFRNPIKGRLSQPDFTDSNTSGISNFPGTSTNNISFSDANTFYSQSQEPSQENFPNTTAHQSEFTLSVQQQESLRMFQHRNKEHPESFRPEKYFECTKRQTDYFDSFKHENSLDCEQNRKSSERQKSKDSKLSAIFYRLQDSEGFIQSIEITTDDQVEGTNTLPPVDLTLVWNRKYCDSKILVSFNLTHPLHYKREYDRIRQSRLSVFDSLMSRQMNGPLSQRKVLEVVARPHYNIFPPADETYIKRCEQALYFDEFMNGEGYLLLIMESFRTFDSYPTSSAK